MAIIFKTKAQAEAERKALEISLHAAGWNAALALLGPLSAFQVVEQQKEIESLKDRLAKAEAWAEERISKAEADAESVREQLRVAEWQVFELMAKLDAALSGK